MHAEPDKIQSEFDAIKEHLESYLATSTPAPAASRGSTSSRQRQPTRHISHLTQMAAKALDRDVPGLARPKARLGNTGPQDEQHTAWDTLAPYASKSSWRDTGLEKGMVDVEHMTSMKKLEIAEVDRRWAHSWDAERTAKWVATNKPMVSMLMTELSIPSVYPYRPR